VNREQRRAREVEQLRRELRPHEEETYGYGIAVVLYETLAWQRRVRKLQEALRSRVQTAVVARGAG
jgi:hypothetical protein